MCFPGRCDIDGLATVAQGLLVYEHLSTTHAALTQTPDTAFAHIDHQYLAVVDLSTPAQEPKHPFGWFAVEDLSRLAMPEDTRLLARHLFSRIADLAAGVLDDAAVLRSFAAAAAGGGGGGGGTR